MTEPEKKQQRRSRWVPAKAERYMQGAELELNAFARLIEHDGGDEKQVLLLHAQVKAQLAVASATIRAAEATEYQNQILGQIGELLSMHPIISHVMATRNVMGELQAENTALKLTLEAAVAGQVEVHRVEVGVHHDEPEKKEKDDKPATKPN